MVKRFKSSGKRSSSAELNSCDLNLLRPDIYGLLEEGERRASSIRSVFVGIALVVWVMVALRAWEIGVIVIERRPDEFEATRLSQEIEGVSAQLNVIPRPVREAREQLLAKADWSSRMSEIRNLAPEGCVFGPYNVRNDATVQLSGFVTEPAVYAHVLDSVSKAGFVTGVRSASLLVRQGYYEFRIIIATRTAD